MKAGKNRRSSALSRVLLQSEMNFFKLGDDFRPAFLVGVQEQQGLSQFFRRCLFLNEFRNDKAACQNIGQADVRQVTHSLHKEMGKRR